jgi:hypothetical protein
MACRFKVDPVINKPLFSHKEDGIRFMSNRFYSMGIYSVKHNVNRLHSDFWVIDPQKFFPCIEAGLHDRPFKNVRDSQM